MSKILDYLIVALAGVGFLLQLGTIGALERDTIGFGQFFAQMSIAWLIWLVAFLIGLVRRTP